MRRAAERCRDAQGSDRCFGMELRQVRHAHRPHLRAADRRHGDGREVLHLHGQQAVRGAAEHVYRAHGRRGARADGELLQPAGIRAARRRGQGARRRPGRPDAYGARPHAGPDAYADAGRPHAGPDARAGLDVHGHAGVGRVHHHGKPEHAGRLQPGYPGRYGVRQQPEQPVRRQGGQLPGARRQQLGGRGGHDAHHAADQERQAGGGGRRLQDARARHPEPRVHHAGAGHVRRAAERCRDAQGSDRCFGMELRQVRHAHRPHLRAADRRHGDGREVLHLHGQQAVRGAAEHVYRAHGRRGARADGELLQPAGIRAARRRGQGARRRPGRPDAHTGRPHAGCDAHVG